MLSIIRDIISILRWRVGAFFALSVVRGVGETFRLSMVLLLLPFLGVETETPLDASVISSLEWVGISYSLTSIGSAIALSFILQSFINIIFAWYSAGYANFFAYVWRVRLAEAFAAAKWRVFLDLPGGKIQNALSQECGRLVAILRNIFRFASGIVVVGAYFVAAMSTNMFASLVLVAFSSVVLLVNRAFSGPIVARSRQFAQQNHDLLRVATEQLNSMKTMKAMARDRGLVGMLKRPFKGLMRNQRLINLLTTLYRQSVELVFGIALILAIITILEFNPDSRNAGLVPVLIIFVRAITQANAALTAWQSVNGLRGSYEFVHELWDEASQMPEPSDYYKRSFRASDFRDRIVFRDVAVHYPRGVALQGFSIDVAFGEMTAIVGPSGAGKTTFVDTLLRLHDLQNGEIRVDGVSIDRFSLSSWRQNIGYVSQDSCLLDATIADNIRLGMPEAPFAEIEQAARRAGADEFIRMMPSGYNTLVGDRGVQLSGGQRQRIALASALLPNPPILILDEATSALDSATEASVMEAIGAMRGCRTLIIISHRLSTVTRADKIYVLDNGSVSESGKWHELLEQRGLFAEMWEYQGGGK